MDDPTLSNRGAPPQTDAQANPSGSAAPFPEEASGPLESGQSPWPSIPDVPLDLRGATPTPPSSQPLTGSYQPGYPQVPLLPPQPGAPSVPLSAYPASASQPVYQGASMPTVPGWGSSLPPTYPGYPGSPSLPLSPSPSMPMSGVWMAGQPRSALARAFPFWLSLLLTVSVVLLMALVYVADEVLIHGDWAAGARAAGVAALILAGGTVLLLVVRVSVGRRAMSTVILSLFLAGLLLGAGASGIAFGNPLHSIQAQTLERSGDWSGAIYEYELYGEKAPNAPNIARIYDEWGEHDFQQQSYTSAATHFTTVITLYGQSGGAVDRAQADLFKTYTTWVQANDPSVPYSDAIADMVAYRSGPQCDDACQTASKAVEAQARYQYGIQLLGQQQYSSAIQQLELVQSQFATSPYAQQAHLAAAQAYFALGQQQLQSSCSDAISAYQTLAKKYGDTTEGAKAKAALAAPQSVTGNISNFSDPNRTVYLSRSVNLGTFSFSQDYHTSVDSHGNFTFHGVTQGKYNLSAASYTSGSYVVYPYWSGNGNDLYSVQVGPLCAPPFLQLSFQ